MSSCADGFLSLQPVRILMVTLREGSWAVMALRISNSLLGLFIMADPQPRLHTRSIGQAEFKSWVMIYVKVGECEHMGDRTVEVTVLLDTYHEVGLYFVLQNLHRRQCSTLR